MIRVVVGDLTREAVDAVLRPANEDLAPVGALAARLDEVGGAPFAAHRRTATPLEAGAAVVTGAGDLPAGYVLHVVVQDERGAASRDRLRRSLVSAWQRAADWGMARVAAPLLGVADGRLSLEESTALLAETFPGGAEGDGMELRIVVEGAAVQEQVEAIVRRKT